MRKWLAIPLILVTVFIMLVGSCGGTTTPSSTTTTTTKTSTTTSTSTSTTTKTTTPTSTTTTATAVAPYGTMTGVTASFGYDTNDPNLVGNWYTLTFQAIVRTTEDANFEGDVVDSWDISADGLTWTFHVKPNNKFTNGDPVTAADLKFSIERFATSARSAWSPYLKASYNFVSMTVVDNLTLKYTVAHPEVTLLAAFGSVCVLDKTEFDKVGEAAYFKNPVGSGPWKLVEYIAGTSIKFEANTNYCRPTEVPKFQYYNELLVPELATRIAMFKNHEIDVLGLDDYARMKELQNQGYPIQKYGINGTDSFAFQYSWEDAAGPVHDIRIRQAMSYALNRQEICDTWYSGYAIPGGQFFMPHGIFGWTDKLAADPYDPAKAKQLMADAGYPSAFANPVITIYTPSSSQDRMLYYMSYWQTIGLQVQLKVFDLSTYYSYLGFGAPPGGNEGWIWFWKSWSYPISVYHSANMYTSKGVHKTTNDATADEMYASITHESDYNKAFKAMQDFQVYVKSLYTNIGVVEYSSYFLYAPSVIGAFEGRSFSSYYDALQGATHAKP
jgi:peptide/nickel transport system substrate-binding protein